MSKPFNLDDALAPLAAPDAPVQEDLKLDEWHLTIALPLAVEHIQLSLVVIKDGAQAVLPNED